MGRPPMSIIRATLLAISLGLVCFLFFHGTSFAQDNGSGQPTGTTEQSQRLDIVSINTSRFPTVELSVSAGSATPLLSNLSLAVRENQQSTPVLLTPRELYSSAGTQVAIAIDPLNLTAVGPTNLPLFAEVANQVRSMVSFGTFPLAADQMATYSIDNNGALILVANWSVPAQIANELLESAQATMASPNPNIEERTAEGALTNLMLQVLNQFPVASGFPAPARNVLLFTSDTTMPDIAQIEAKASESRTHLYIIQLVVDGQNSEPSEALEQLAAATGGRYLLLDQVDETKMSDFWQSIQAEGPQQIFSYESTTPDLKSIEIATKIQDSIISSTINISPPLQLQPVSISLVYPNSETSQIELPEEMPVDNGVAAEEPLTVAVDFTWPDNYTRTLKQVTYTLSGPNDLQITKVVTTAPFTEEIFPIASQVEGAYLVDVKAIDTLGFVGEMAIPKSLQIVRRQSATAVPTVVLPLTATPLPTASPSSSTTDELPTIAVTATPGDRDLDEQNGLPREILWITLLMLVGLLGLYLVYPSFLNRFARGLRNLLKRPAVGPQDTFKEINSNNEVSSVRPSVVEPPVLAPLSSRAQDESREPMVSKGASQKASTGEMLSEEIALEETPPEEASVGHSPYGDNSTIHIPYIDMPVVGYLVRQGNDPNLPSRLTIYNINQAFVGRNDPDSPDGTRNTLAINDRRVSRIQARITNRNGRVYIADRGSGAGTYVNGQKLESEKEHLLEPGDTIHFGQIVYEFHVRETREDDQATIST